MNQTKQVYISTAYFLTVYFDTILPSTPTFCKLSLLNSVFRPKHYLIFILACLISFLSPQQNTMNTEQALKLLSYIPSMALQPLLLSDLPQKTHQFLFYVRLNNEVSYYVTFSNLLLLHPASCYL